MAYEETKQPDKKDAGTIAKRFKELDSKRTSLLNRCEDYALWTLPYIFPKDLKDTEQSEQQGPLDSIGARAVNNLSNKLTLTLFQPHSPFFRLMATDELLNELKAESDAGNREAQAILETLDKALLTAEKSAMRELNYTHYRTEATTAAKALIITGNSLLYHPEGKGKAQVYSLRDYVVVRDLSGEVIEIITRDTKALNTFSQKLRDQVALSRDPKYRKDDCEVVLYTRLKLHDDGKFHLTQAVDEITINSDIASAMWPKDELPWIVLTWNLIRGENYGRGLVEDYAGAFHGLYVLTTAFVDIVGVAADIKWLVNPASVLDVKELNDSESGTYHSGVEGDVTAVQVNKQMDLQYVREQLMDWRQQIGQAFLLFSAVQRDAERVTAEEIRQVINDLEVSHGGIYSRFADEWQFKTAKLILKRVKINIGDGRQIFPQIITGLDSLSRAGDMDNLRMFMQDMSMLQTVPDDIRAVIDPFKFAAFVGVRRGVEYEKIIKTQDQIQQEQQAAMQQQQQMMQAEAGAEMAVETGKAALKE